MIQYALQNLMLDFLNPIDHMENALKFTEQASSEVKHWAAGFVMIFNQFKDLLTNNGVYPFDSEGQPFDPHFHEAIEMVTTTEHPPGTIVKETVRGYKIGDRVLRPASVTVAKAPPEETPQESKEEKQGENND